jgi:hypothetical protein
MDQALTGRITACAAQEGSQFPDQRANETRWFICTRSDIEAAYASALAGENPNPGGDESVITDQMILSAFQAAPPSPVINP